jgi:hypothetical protein
MYFPFLRGRQFELIAIRELLEKELIHEKVIPIIEPIKLSSTLTKTLSLFIEKNKEIALIHNPKVGNFHEELKREDSIKNAYNSHILEDCIIKAHIVNVKTETEIKTMAELGFNKNDMITIVFERDNLEYYNSEFGNIITRFNLIPDDRTFKRVVRDNKVLIDDKFNKQIRNAAYMDKDDFFSDDHLFFGDEGYKGFSDFSVVGSDYSESGFAPYAVAIHIVYFDNDRNLRIIHFVSESNDDIQDPGGKFYEAVSKLYEWQIGKNINTFAMREFIEHYYKGTYPGLGTAKKLSIMHHLELISQYFNGDI